MPDRYRKLPVEIEAEQWTGRNEPVLHQFTGGLFRKVHDSDAGITAEVFDTLHSTWVGVKTWQHIIKGVKGEFYPIDQAVLAETYERVASDA